MDRLLLLLVLFSLNANAFYLSNNTGRGFSSNSIDLYIANDDCANAGFNTQEYKKMIEDAVEFYWNNVPTSALHINVKGISSSISINGDDHSAAMLKTPANSILAGCNDDVSGFDCSGGGGCSLGSALMNCDGATCRSVLILNADSSSILQTYSDDAIESVIAHEIGHAIGIGHSEFEHSLMYFSVSGKYQKWLGQDDIDAVTYLYPNEGSVLGLFGSCGTIALIDNNDDDDSSGTGAFLTSLVFGILLMLLLFRVPRYRIGSLLRS